MKTKNERPVIFKAEMVRAILEGRKTQTRRVIKPQPDIEHAGEYKETWPEKWGICCPYGVAGDRLWVRETWRQGTPMLNGPDLNGDVAYRADYPNSNAKWKPSIFMPRWASRISLEITKVRVERLQEISEEDALAEGVEYHQAVTARSMYHALWDSINGKGAWELNPFVWVVDFKSP